MDVSLGEAELREQLMLRSEEYRRLAAEHQSYAKELEQLNSRLYLSEEEKLREITLKKKKLLVKDQMFVMMQQYRKKLESGS